MKKLSLVLVAAGLVSLAACKPAETANVSNDTGAMMENATNGMEAASDNAMMAANTMAEAGNTMSNASDNAMMAANTTNAM